MTEIVLDDRLLVAILGAIATLGIAFGGNRRHIARIEDRLWGPERGTDGGIEEALASLDADRLRIETEVEALRRRLERLEDQRKEEGTVSGSGPQRVTTPRAGDPRSVRFRPDDVD